MVLFDAGVPEAVIQKRTGHKSLDSLHLYERVTLEQEQNVANILTPNPHQQKKQVTDVDTSSDNMFLDSLPEEAFNF